jgi:hypothetical protein
MRAAGIPHAEATPAVSSTALFVHQRILPAAAALLPARLDAVKARVMLIAIALQESRLEHRRQIRGPARGFWQFESGGGVHGVLTHAASKPLIEPVLATLRYAPGDCYDAIANNDVLACVFARLLLWTHPKALPASAETAWAYYLATWRPGKPHSQTWDAFYRQAWAMEEGSQ